MHNVSGCIYISEYLEKLYTSKFNNKSTYIMTSSSIKRKKLESKKNVFPVVSYVGNLSNNRYKSLIEIANALGALDNNYRLNIYGKLNQKHIETQIMNCKSLQLIMIINQF